LGRKWKQEILEGEFLHLLTNFGRKISIKEGIALYLGWKDLGLIRILLRENNM